MSDAGGRPEEINPEEINVGVFNQLVWLDVETPHEFARLTNAGVRRLIVGQHNLEFKKVPQLLHRVDMNASPPLALRCH